MASSSLLQFCLLVFLSFISLCFGRMFWDSAAPPPVKTFICGYNGSEVHHQHRRHHHDPDQMVRGDRRRTLYTVIRSAYFRKTGPEPKVVTYALQPDSIYGRLSREEILATLRKACERWEAVAPLRFRQVPDGMEADVRVGFYEGEHGDRNPFDGPGGVAAHASTLDEDLRGADLHVDASENWTTDLGKHNENAAAPMLDLETVLVHELGHVIGLGHTTVESAVMYPSISMGTRKVELDADDIKGMKELFGLT